MKESPSIATIVISISSVALCHSDAAAKRQSSEKL